MPISPDIKNPLLSNMNTEAKLFGEKNKNYEEIQAMEISETSICGDLLKTGCKSGSKMLSEENSQIISKHSI